MGKQLPLVRPRQSDSALLMRIDLANRPRLSADRALLEAQTRSLSGDPVTRRRFAGDPGGYLRTVGLTGETPSPVPWNPEAQLVTSEVCTLLTYCNIALIYASYVTVGYTVNVALNFGLVADAYVYMGVYISGFGDFGVAGEGNLVSPLPGSFTSPVL